ncbi:MAG: DUF1254 domain-containing protein [Pseudomonadota bacterium]
MNRSWVLPAAVFVLVAAVAHALTLSKLPSVIMTRAIDTMAERGVPLHQFVVAPRATPESQSVVRSSPDVAYSVCRFDLSRGPVLVQGAPWDSYGSLNVYDGQTDNVVGFDLGPETPVVTGTVIGLAKHKDHPVPEGMRFQVLSSPKGLALIRRVAPTDAYYAMAEEAAKGDICRPL